MTLSELIAEIQAELPTYAQDINKITVKTNVIQRLRIFGNNIAELKETVVKIENSSVQLPADFKSLKMALKIESTDCDNKCDKVRNSYIYKEYVERPAYYDRINQEYVTNCDSKIITEKIIIDGEHANFKHRYQWLSVIKGVKKDSFAVDCLNLHPTIRNGYKHEINITNGHLNANFKEGLIYIQYYGIPTDEDGDIIIPEITTGDILQYVKAYIKVELAEFVIANNLNPVGISQLYPNWKQELMMLKRAALTEAKFAGLDKGWARKFKTLNKRDISVFNLPKFRF